MPACVRATIAATSACPRTSSSNSSLESSFRASCLVHRRKLSSDCCKNAFASSFDAARKSFSVPVARPFTPPRTVLVKSSNLLIGPPLQSLLLLPGRSGLAETRTAPGVLLVGFQTDDLVERRAELEFFFSPIGLREPSLLSPPFGKGAVQVAVRVPQKLPLLR